MIDIRPPDERDREQVADAMRVSFNMRSAGLVERAAALDLPRFLCGYDGDRVVAAAATRSFRQWFGGNEMPMCGVYGVVTLPEYRASGLAREAVARLLRRARDEGVPIAALYPAVLRPYRRIGFELAGTMTEHTVRLDDLPTVAGPLSVEEYEPVDLEAVRACYRRVASGHNGPIDCDDDRWWPIRILGGWGIEGIARTVVVRGEDGIEGYAAFAHDEAEGDLETSFDLGCKHLVTATADGLKSLLAYFRGFRGIGQALTFFGPPADPLALVVEEQRVRPKWSFRWMLRILDVPGAFESRGYPPVSGEAVISVEDPMFAENGGPFRIEADAGKVRVTPADQAKATPKPIPIGALSSMFTGFLSPDDAVRLGLLQEGDRSNSFLGNLLGGPAPWMYDWF
jgi:predicted acetyltransferase